MPFAETNVKEALDSMHLNKSPGIDELNPAFFQHFWSIAGKDITRECLRIINTRYIPLLKNRTKIKDETITNASDLTRFGRICLRVTNYMNIYKLYSVQFY